MHVSQSAQASELIRQIRTTADPRHAARQHAAKPADASQGVPPTEEFALTPSTVAAKLIVALSQRSVVEGLTPIDSNSSRYACS